MRLCIQLDGRAGREGDRLNLNSVIYLPCAVIYNFFGPRSRIEDQPYSILGLVK